LGGLQRVHLLAAIDDKRLLAAHGRSAITPGVTLKLLSEITQVTALVVEDVKRNVGPGAHHEIVGRALHQRFPRARAATATPPKIPNAHGRCRRMCGQGSVELSSTLARMRCRDISSRPKCEMRPTWIRARSCRRQSLSLRSTARLFALLVHIDEVDDDQARQVAQAQLPCDFLGGFEIGLERGILDVMLTGRAAGIDVDRNQRFGLVDHDVAAGPQLHGRRGTIASSWLSTPIRENSGWPSRYCLTARTFDGISNLHEIAGFLIAGLAGDQDFRRSPCCRGRAAIA